MNDLDQFCALHPKIDRATAERVHGRIEALVEPSTRACHADDVLFVVVGANGEDDSLAWRDRMQVRAMLIEDAIAPGSTMTLAKIGLVAMFLGHAPPPPSVWVVIDWGDGAEIATLLFEPGEAMGPAVAEFLSRGPFLVGDEDAINAALRRVQ